MKKESWALLLSSVAVLISLVAICVACPHKAELGFDYQGVIVGVLSCSDNSNRMADIYIYRYK